MERKLKQSVRRNGLLVLVAFLALAAVLFVLTGAAQAQTGTSEPVPPDKRSPLEASFKMASKAMLGPGETVTFTIMLINTGHEAVTATVVDQLPAALTYVDGSAAAGGVFDSGSRTVTWSQVSVPAGGRLPLKLAATAPETITDCMVAVNDASIQAGSNKPLHRKASVLLLAPHPEEQHEFPLAGSFKEASKKQVAPGEILTYTLHLINSSPADTTASVVDKLPPLMTYVSNTVSGGGVFSATEKTLSWTGLTVPAGGSLELTFQAQAGMNPYTHSHRHVPVKNVMTVHIEGGKTFARQVTVVLAPNPEQGDFIRPVVHSVTIDDGDVLESPTTTLHISATDNVAVKWMFVREWELATLPSPHWKVSRSSGWVPFQADFPWTLIDDSGTHFVSVWVADAAHNVSHTSRRSMDFASLLLPDTFVPEHKIVPYLVSYDMGVNVTATLTTTAGNADLFVWYPRSLFFPDQASTHPGTEVDEVTFTTPRPGVYIFLVRATLASTYTLAIQPAGGFNPAVAQTASTLQAAPEAFASTESATPSADFSYEPVVSAAGLDPLPLAVEPEFNFTIYLPQIRH